MVPEIATFKAQYIKVINRSSPELPLPSLIILVKLSHQVLKLNPSARPKNDSKKTIITADTELIANRNRTKFEPFDKAFSKWYFNKFEYFFRIKFLERLLMLRLKVKQIFNHPIR